MKPAPLQETETPNADRTILRVENLGKNYGGVVALRDVDLSIRAGTIHGLLGENGAGKSTLVGIMSGQRQPSSGTIYLDEQPLHHVDVQAMEEAGVFLVTQEPMIIDHLSAAENLMLGIWPKRRFGFVNWGKLRSDAERMLEGTGIPSETRAGLLDAVARRKINILRAMFSGGKVIILDEPTAALTVDDRAQLFDFMRRLKSEGVTFIFISHFNDEILEICDAVSVLRDGQYAGGSEDVGGMTSEDLSELVLGRGLVLFERKRPVFEPSTPAIELRNIRSAKVDLPELRIRSGEVLGITGLPGGGGKELARVLFGLEPGRSGTIRFPDGEERELPEHPSEAFAAGIAYLSDDRRKDGSIAQMSIAHNISLSAEVALASGAFLKPEQERALSERYFGSLGIKAPDSGVAVDTLSGGNQQKVCLGRVLATEPKLLMLDEPTRGIDVGVKQDVLRIVDELSRTGVSVIIISTDTDELVRAVDRVLIFQGGRVREELAGENITRSKLRDLG
ncbi:MAG: sugar ABC transporter ATP-binding protein [Rhizobiales bacterium]|nr:sugar ABC transporter ATP-binding protein [Hyphomicrobiales bacterium]MBA70822.1 sugar ABC transporter ATP-binding protein [Hyphomicrobiales bacterium]|tara:strand:+ start:2476 stop:3996 length:1521 start_codon:yes stop_codon:yes gene_type:complete